jgi:hypothetical protein
MTVLFIPIGAYFLFKSLPRFALFVFACLAGALTVIGFAKMPMMELSAVYGYTERYQMIAMPFLALLSGVGIDGCYTKMSKYQKLFFVTCLIVSFTLTVWRAWGVAIHVNNDLVEIFSDEVALEVNGYELFISQSDFELFYGHRCGTGVCFPIKNLFGFRWYRTHSAPGIDPRIEEIFAANPRNYFEFLEIAFDKGIPIASTTAAPFLSNSKIMAGAHQTGLVWHFHKSNTALYDESIVANTQRMCQSLQQSRTGLPYSTNYFQMEFLEKFQLAFRSAGDYLTTKGKFDLANIAVTISTALAVESDQWKTLCQLYGRMSEPH